MEKKKCEYWEKLLGKEAFEKYLEREDDKEEGLAASENFRQYVISGGLESTETYSAEKLKEKILFPQFYRIFLNYGISRLAGYLKGRKECFSESLYDDFAVHLAGQLQSICMRTLIVKLHDAKQAGGLKGKDSREEYAFFCEKQVGDRDFIQGLLEQFPALFACVETRIEQMTAYYLEVIEHFEKDKQEIGGKLCGGTEAGVVVSVTGDFSDTHNSGRQVLKIRLNNGTEILYKPHSMENERVYGDLLLWLSGKTGIRQYSYPFLSCETYSWSSIVEYGSCKSQEEMKQYYTRLGVQLFLSYFLGTKDLHCENIIACGAYPVLVDLETLVNIRYNKGRTSVNEEIFYQLSQSVLYTGLLPYYHWNQGGAGIDSSGVSGGSGQKYPFKIPAVVNAGTSDMRIEYRQPMSGESKNLARLRGVFCEPSGYKEEMVAGFVAAYETVMEEKEEFAAMLEKLGKTTSRFLMAETQRYGMLLSASFHPGLLMNGLDRRIFLYSMWQGRKDGDAEIVESEMRQLLDGDIPYFSYKLDERHLRADKDVVIKDYFADTVTDLLYERLWALHKGDMERQCDCIRITLALAPDEKESYMNHVYLADDRELLRDGKEVVIEKYTEELAERLQSYAVWNRDRTEVSWFTLQMSSFGKMTWDIRPMNMYLYDGLAGMLLLAYALKTTRETEEWHYIYETLKQMLFRYTDAESEAAVHLQSENTGAYDGESSIVYVYLALYSLSGEKKYLDYARKHAAIVEKLLGRDEKYDLLSGNAGAAQVFLRLYEVTAEDGYITLAEQAIAVLEKAAEKQEQGIGWTVEKHMPPMAGVAHGNSGILLPVMALWKKTGKEKYEKLAEQIWQYEEFLYNPRTNNWDDVRAKADNIDDIGAVAWCHGAGGILHYRRQCAENMENAKWKERLERDMERAQKTLERYWKRDSWCLCHGMCGNLWMLNRGTDLPVGGWKLLPQEQINPGLMSGYGGILYYLLRMNGRELPDVLGLEIYCGQEREC